MNDNKGNDSTQPTLTEFIKGNHQLISTLAILAALSAFSNSLPDKLMGKTLSFLFFTMSLIVYIEIEFNFPYTTKSKLHWFRQLFELTALVFCMAWFQMYYRVLIVVGYFVVWL